MDHIKNTITAQRTFFTKNKTKDIDFRLQQLKKLKALIKNNEEKLNEAIYKDFKKSKFDNYLNELSLIYSDIDEACKKIRKWTKTKKVKVNMINFPAKSYVIPEPLGLSLIIGAWNYPYQLSLAPVISSIAAGNTIILKPSELSAHTSKIMADLVNNNFAPEYFTVVEGGANETSELLEYKFDKIFFTGSVAVGKIIYQKAAKFLTPCTLELGGKSPAIVTKDCNLKMCVKRLVWAKYLNAGQTCIAPDYVMVEKDIKDKFLEAFKKEIEDCHFSFENKNYVQIITERHTQRAIDLIGTSEIYCGGEYSIKDRYIEPTVLTNVTYDDKVMQEEIFAPILPVIEFTDIDNVISKIKEQPKPLASYLFSNSKKIKRKFLHEVSFGGGAINEAVMHITNPNMGFGGVGESGIGAYHGINGFKAFTHYKSILDKPTWFEASIKHFPQTALKLKLFKKLMGQ